MCGVYRIQYFTNCGVSASNGTISFPPAAGGSGGKFSDVVGASNGGGGIDRPALQILTKSVDETHHLQKSLLTHIEYHDHDEQRDLHRHC